MDPQTRLETFKDSLRLKYADNPKGLRSYIADLHEAADSTEVAITSTTLEGGSNSGQLVLEPLAKLNAALAVLREIAPELLPDAADTVVFADFRGGYLDT